MFKNIPPLFAVPLRYGFIGAVLAILIIVVLFYINRHPLLIPVFLDYRILLFGILIFFGLKEFKEVHNDNYLQFWQGLTIGVIIYLIIGLVAGTFVSLFPKIDHQFYEQYINGTLSGLELEKEQLTETGKVTISEEEYNKQVEMLKNAPNYILGIDYFIKSCIVGFFIAILLSVILRRSEPRFTR